MLKVLTMKKRTQKCIELSEQQLPLDILSKVGQPLHHLPYSGWTGSPCAKLSGLVTYIRQEQNCDTTIKYE